MNNNCTDFGQFQVFDGKIIRSQQIGGYTVHGVFKIERIKEIMNSEPTPERSVAPVAE
jgi:hypothetical protein